MESAWFSASLPCLQAAWSQPPRTATLLLSMSHCTFQSPISESPAPWPPSLPSCSSHLGSLSGLSLSPSTPRWPLGSLHHPPLLSAFLSFPSHHIQPSPVHTPLSPVLSTPLHVDSFHGKRVGGRRRLAMNKGRGLPRCGSDRGRRAEKVGK